MTRRFRFVNIKFLGQDDSATRTTSNNEDHQNLSILLLYNGNDIWLINSNAKVVLLLVIFNQ